MTSLPPYVILMALCLAALVLEMVTGSFVFVSFSAGFLAAALAEVVTSGVGYAFGALLFIIVSAATFAGLRLAFHTRGDVRHHEGDINRY